MHSCSQCTLTVSALWLLGMHLSALAVCFWGPSTFIFTVHFYDKDRQVLILVFDRPLWVFWMSNFDPSNPPFFDCPISQISHFQSFGSSSFVREGNCFICSCLYSIGIVYRLGSESLFIRTPATQRSQNPDKKRFWPPDVMFLQEKQFPSLHDRQQSFWPSSWIPMDRKL